MPSLPKPPSEPGDSIEQEHRDGTCVGCGCLCDDLTVKTQSGRIVEVTNACHLGRHWLLQHRPDNQGAVASIRGTEVEASEALEQAAALIAQARFPLVLGLTRTTTEGVAAALELADLAGATVDIGVSEGDRARLFAVQRVGRVSATLGEVKNRADVVLFWGVDPLTTHPRHWERYSVEPKGRFVPRGRADRTVIVVDAKRTPTAEQADLFLTLDPDTQFEALHVLRALLRDAVLDPTHVKQSTGLELDVLIDLRDRLKQAKYGVCFVEPSPGSSGASARTEAALAFVRDLNQFTRFVLLGMGSGANIPGAEAVSTWQTGFAGEVSLNSGAPRSLRGVTSAETQLARGQADLALIVGKLAPATLSEQARAHLARIPRVVIGSEAMTTRENVPLEVTLRSSTYGVDTPGTVTRTDGVVLPLRPFLTPRRPTDQEWLEALSRRVREIQKG